MEALRGDAEFYKAVRVRHVAFLTFAMNYKILGFDVEGYHRKSRHPSA